MTMASSPNTATNQILLSAGDGVQILNPAVGPDTMAVLGAMMSRTPDLAQKIDSVLAKVAEEDGVESWDFRTPPTRIRKFLDDNLKNYGHASIAAMAKACWIYVHGFGWPAAWLLMDAMLWDGQELSTRAVDATKVLGADGTPGTPCRYAPANLHAIHDKWLALYTEAASHLGAQSGWKFDDARLLLPGTVSTGVVITNDARSIARHMDHIASLGGAAHELSEQVYRGLDAASPAVTGAIGRKSRQPLSQWSIRNLSLSSAELSRLDTAAASVSVSMHDSGATERDWQMILESTTPRPGPRQYLDPMWKLAPRIRFTVRCTVAVARDWHRHRPVMPWRLSVITDPDGCLVFAPWAKLRDSVSRELLTTTTAAAYEAGLPRPGSINIPPTAKALMSLHALPFGALVELECVATLPDLLYMLELRYGAPGANEEYRDQAGAAIDQMSSLLPAHIVQREHLCAALGSDARASHPI